MEQIISDIFYGSYIFIFATSVFISYLIKDAGVSDNPVAIVPLFVLQAVQFAWWICLIFTINWPIFIVFAIFQVYLLKFNTGLFAQILALAVIPLYIAVMINQYFLKINLIDLF